jgi:DNA polymerase-3 subunit delta
LVAVKNHEADRFLARLPSHVFLYLVFGTDRGLVNERAKLIATRAVDDPKDAFQFLRMNGDEIAADPLQLADEANSIPLFGGKKAIWITAGSCNIAPALEPILAAPPEQCTIVIEAGALKKDAALRKTFEREKCAAAVECYPDSEKDILRLIETELSAANLTIETEAKTLLLSLLGEDRLTTRAEVEKLVLYAHGKGQVSVEAIEHIVADASSVAVDAAVNGAFNGDFAAVEKTAEKVFAEGGDYNMLLGAALRHATQLHRLRLARDEGLAAEASGGGFKRAAVIDQQMRCWTANRLGRTIHILGEAIRAARRDPRLSEPIAVRALWSIALAARNRNG